LGLCYDYGIGVDKDEIEAVKWYRKAAEQGYSNAQYNLSVKLLSKGHCIAQYKLGCCYAVAARQRILIFLRNFV